MGKQKLYIDFDGVILDTIRLSYRMIEQLGLKYEEEITTFYKTVKWSHLIRIAPEINNSIAKIQKIIKSNMFDVAILTHVNSDEEAIEKINYIRDKLPGIEVIPVPKVINKCDMVNPNDAILVDDYSPNLVLWQEKGGISVKFSDSGKLSEFITITDLEQIINIFGIKNKNKNKKLINNH